MIKPKRRELIVFWMIDFIKNINKFNKIVTREKLIAEACLKFACGERLVKEILNHLLISGKLVIEFGEIWVPGALEDQKILEGGLHKNERPT